MKIRYIIKVLFRGSDGFMQIAKENDADTAGYWVGHYLTKDNITATKIEKVFE